MRQFKHSMPGCAGSVETPARLANRNGLTGRKVLSFEGHIWLRGAVRRVDVVDAFRRLRQGVCQTPHRLGSVRRMKGWPCDVAGGVGGSDQRVLRIRSSPSDHFARSTPRLCRWPPATVDQG
jgi:hypothetical protein